MTRTCSCGAAISAKNRSGLCRPCNARRINADPAIEAKRAAGRAAYFDRPGVREGYARRIAEYRENMPDEHRERCREHGRRQYRDVLSRPDVVAKSLSPEVRAAAGRKRTDTVLAWCPPHLRDAYRGLIRSGIRAAEARAMIEEEIPGTAAHARRVVANNALKMRLKHERERMEAY